MIYSIKDTYRLSENGIETFSAIKERGNWNAELNSLAFEFGFLKKKEYWLKTWFYNVFLSDKKSIVLEDLFNKYTERYMGAATMQSEQAVTFTADLIEKDLVVLCTESE